MRIAHLSDLHLLDLTGAAPIRFANKRLTGYVNLRLKRGHTHKPAPVFAAAEAIRDAGVDHVVITGDLSNLALEREFDRVNDLLGRFGLPPTEVSLVPGNHDAYTRGAVRSDRFRSWFGAHLTSDLPALGKPGSVAAAFPYVRLRGPVAIVGLSSAVARPPLVASGSLGRPQLERLAALLAHPEVAKRTPVVLLHHPIHNPASYVKTLAEGLVDASELAKVLDGQSRGLLLHGHLHRRIHRELATRGGHLDAIGATSASLLDDRDDRMAGYNLYEIDDADGHIVSTRSFRYLRTGGFVETEIPSLAAA